MIRVTSLPTEVACRTDSVRRVTVQGDGRFYVETLGCPKNQVDSDKIVGTLLTDGLVPTGDASLPMWSW